jgi:hypothetical protein
MADPCVETSGSTKGEEFLDQVTSPNRIREVRISNLCPVTSYPGRWFSWLYSVLLSANSDVILQNMSQPIPPII